MKNINSMCTIRAYSRHSLILLLCMFAYPLFAQTDIACLAPGAESQLAALLNKPALVQSAAAEPLGKNWFRMELDAHVFTDQANLEQVRSVLLDMENHDRIFDGKKNKRRASVVSRTAGETIVDFVSVTVAPLGIQIKTNYRASMRTTINTESGFACEIRQTPQDSDSNRDIKNLVAIRYAQEVIINGDTYTYIRIYSIDDVNAGILPNAKKTFENNSGPANEEALELIIAAARTR